MAVLAIFQPDVRAQARLSSALSGAHDVTTHASWESFRRMVSDGGVEGCVIDADHPDRQSASARISEIRSRTPELAIIASVETNHAEGFLHLGELGVDGVVFASSSVGAMRSDVDAAFSTRRARNVAEMLRVRIADPGPAAVAWAMEHAGLSPSVDRLAAALGFTPGGLRDALQEADLPRPSKLLLWGRLILAGARLGDDGRRVEDVAFSMGYSTATSFARAMKVHVGLTPAEVSRRGGMGVVLDALFPPEATRGRRSGKGSAGSGGGSSRVASLGLLLFLVGCATFGGGSGVDRGAFDARLTTPPFDQMHIGVLAVDARTGQTLLSHNANRRFVPASNQKILVTATALSLLGPDFRFRTEVVARGERRGALLDGDLVVVGSGDPSLSARYWPSGVAALDVLAGRIREAGIERVTGSLVVDVTAWDSTTVGPTWEVEDLRYSYGSTGGAFSIEEGEIEVVLEAGAEPGSPARVRWQPVGTEDFVRSHVITAPPDSSTRVRPSYLPESRLLVLEGRVALGRSDTLSYAIRDPVRQATAALAGALQRSGVVVDGGWRVRWDADDPDSWCTSWAASCTGGTGVATLESPPLSTLVAGVLEPSQNWMTEQLVRALGARFGTTGSWSEGTGVVTHYLVNEIGIDPADVSPRDGSGLSSYNLVTPRALVRILSDMHEGPWGAIYRSAMAEPGEEDSTLERRLPELRGRLFAKTGTISNVNSLSGYLVREDGREIVFSILSNASGLPSSEVRTAIDDIVRILAR